MWLFLSTRHDDDAGDSKECGEAETDELRDVLSPAANLWRRQGLLYGKHPNPLNFATYKLHRTFSMIVGTKRTQINCHCFNGRLIQCKTTHFFRLIISQNSPRFKTLAISMLSLYFCLPRWWDSPLHPHLVPSGGNALGAGSWLESKPLKWNIFVHLHHNFELNLSILWWTLASRPRMIKHLVLIFLLIIFLAALVYQWKDN